MAAVTFVYFAAPIDQAGTRHAPWRDLLFQAHSLPAGYIGFYPGDAFRVGRGAPLDSRIEVINREALRNCDGVIAFVPAGVATVGVPREIEAAVQDGKPVAVLTDLDRSFSLADLPRFALDGDGLDAALAYARDAPGPPVHEGLAFAVGEGGTMPTRAYSGDAGYDLYVSRSVDVPPGGFVDVHTDIRVALPSHLWARIVGRSSTLRNRGLLVVEGVIDSGYRGWLYSGVRNMTDAPVSVRKGERLAQLIPHLNVAAALPEATGVSQADFDALPHDGRAHSGFGSSGS